MGRQKLQNRMGLLILFIFILHFLATKFYWYYSIYWFDMMMHFFGGCFILLLVGYIFPPKEASTKSVILLLFGVLFVGIAWEVFEYVFKNLIAGEAFDGVDSMSDIFFDMLGGLIASIYFFKRIMPFGESKV